MIHFEATCLSFSCFLYIKWLVISSLQKNGEGLWLHAAGKAYEWGHFIHTFRSWFDCSNVPISGMPYTSNTWVWWEERGELTCPIGTCPWAQSCMCTTPLHISYKYPISPCCAQCVTGIWGIPKLRYIFQRHWWQKDMSLESSPTGWYLVLIYSNCILYSLFPTSVPDMSLIGAYVYTYVFWCISHTNSSLAPRLLPM